MKFRNFVLLLGFTAFGWYSRASQVVESDICVYGGTPPYPYPISYRSIIPRSSGDTNAAVTINYTVSGSAVPGVDYATLPASVTLAARTMSPHRVAGDCAPTSARQPCSRARNCPARSDCWPARSCCSPGSSRRLKSST